LPSQSAEQFEPMAEPPMDVNPAMGDENNGMPPVDSGIGEPENQFDTNFDAGVEANEETDPKKYIQQLTGKLSQSLRSYNENLPQPDADLSKYVAGMIIKQAVNGLSPEDTNEILNEVKDDDSEEPMMTQPQDDMPQQNIEQPIENNDAIGNNGIDVEETINKTNRQKIDEIFNQVMRDKNEDDQIQKPITGIGYKKKPFTSPNFK
jgi:hypothetical protein